MSLLTSGHVPNIETFFFEIALALPVSHRSTQVQQTICCDDEFVRAELHQYILLSWLLEKLTHSGWEFSVLELQSDRKIGETCRFSRKIRKCGQSRVYGIKQKAWHHDLLSCLAWHGTVLAEGKYVVPSRPKAHGTLHKLIEDRRAHSNGGV